MKPLGAIPAALNSDAAGITASRPPARSFDLSLSHIVPLLLLVLAVAWFRYSSQREKFASFQKPDGTKATPLTFPYFSPLGTLPIAYVLQPRDFVLNPKWFFQSAHPVLVEILTYKFFVVRGPENIKALFKSSRECNSIPFNKFALSYAFGLPKNAIRLYDKDDSGGGQIPHPGSNVPAHNRIDYRVHQSLLPLLEGKGLVPFYNRFAKNITQRLNLLHGLAGPEWIQHTDLMQTVADEVTVSTLDALCGPYLLRLNPDFLNDFWVFDRNLQTYLQGLPWFLAPRAFAARRKVLQAVEVWHQHARENSNKGAFDSDGDDPFWGSNVFRERHEMFLEMDGFDHKAIASEDLGAIWASRNSITAASWTIFQIYRDPELLTSVRWELDSCMRKDSDGHVHFDIDDLLRLPILQAVYAETLRLRMHFYIIRMSDRTDLDIRDWVIPRNKVVVALTTVAHMDATVWNTGVNDEYPVDKFWAGRFLKRPAVELSHQIGTEEPASNAAPSRAPTFSTKHVDGAWFPYGGGPRQCPGRHFAKRQILLATALYVSLLDCDMSDEARSMGEDLSLNGFGGGMSHPAGKVPVKMRARVIGGNH